MVHAHFDAVARTGQIVLRPNRSWSWRSNSYFIVTLLIVSLSVAGTFALRGYWLVLPFSALEMTALFGCLYYCVRRANRQEVVTLSDDELIIETGHNRAEQIRRYARFHTQIRVERGDHSWDEPHICVVARDQHQEIGDFLCGDEKRTLVNHLRDMIHALQLR